MAITFFFVILGVLVVFGTQCHCQSCEVNFHMESTSVMLLPNDNVTVLCDATCFGRDSGIDLVWRDAFGREVGFQPSRVFSVRYNRGLMNRILLIRANHDTVGTYICTVLLNGQVLHQKPMEFIILGNPGNVVITPPEDTGPRRGDIPADGDIEYRPVRSVDRTLSTLEKGQLTVDNFVKYNGHLASELLEANSEHESGGELNVLDEGNYQTRMFELMTQTNKRSRQLHKTNNKVQKEKNFGLGTKNRDLVKSRSISEENKLNGLFGIMEKQKSVDLIGAWKFEGDKSSLSTPRLHYGNSTYSGNLRVRRQAMDQTTTEELINETSGDTAATETVSTSSQASNDSSHITSDPEQTSQDAKTLPTQAPEKSTEKATSEKSAGNATPENTDDTDDDSHKTSCTATPSNFGKYGVLAFSITLAVAFLLLYAVLMIIFMPRIMARRKEKGDIEVGAYRRTGPDTSDTAPLTVLESSDMADCDVTKQDTTELDNPTFQNEKKADIKKEETENAASVSTFLLRQDSERKAEEPNKETETKDESKPNDKEDNSPQPDKITTIISPAESNHTENPSSQSPSEDAPPEFGTTQQPSDLMGDFRFSDFMTLSNIEKSEVTSSLDGKSEATKNATEIISENGTATSYDPGTDLLPPPPPDQNNA